MMNELKDLSLSLPLASEHEDNAPTTITNRLRNWLVDKLEPDYKHAIRGSVMIRVRCKKD